jgi:molybdopterin-guanine dinucleotide biosynthesis protein A
MIDAIILAGSERLGKLEGYVEVNNKALIKIGQKCMVEYVVDALKKSSNINRIVIVGPSLEMEKIFKEDARIYFAEAGNNIIASVLSGIEALPNADYFFLSTSDIPLLSAAAIDKFLSLCEKKTADFYYPIVTKQINEKYYPGVKRTYVEFEEGIFTGGNVFLFKAEIAQKCAARGQRLFDLRKKPLALAKEVGLGFLIKFMLKRLSLTEAEIRCSKLLKLVGKVIIIDYPEIGIDVDKPSDLNLVRKVLA